MSAGIIAFILAQERLGLERVLGAVAVRRDHAAKGLEGRERDGPNRFL